MGQEFTDGDEGILFRALPHANAVFANFQENLKVDSSAALPSSESVRSIIHARAIRRQFFDEELFSDPAWDILLELYALDREGVRVSVSKLSVAANVPCTTCLRWIDKLETESLVIRFDDPLDARRVWIELSELGRSTMTAYLRKISTPLPRAIGPDVL